MQKYYTPEEVQQAKAMDLLTYLRQYEPQELVHLSGDNYCTKTHDSLKISNGKWYWFSRGIGGRSALDYLINVNGMSFPDAVGLLLGYGARLPPASPSQPDKPRQQLMLPEPQEGKPIHVVNYLTGRRIAPSIIDYCIEHKLLFESRKYHKTHRPAQLPAVLSEVQEGICHQRRTTENASEQRARRLNAEPASNDENHRRSRLFLRCRRNNPRR